MGKDLGINVSDKVKMEDKFGKFVNQIKGVAGTLQLTDESQKEEMINTAINLSKTTGKAVVVVIRIK